MGVAARHRIHRPRGPGRRQLNCLCVSAMNTKAAEIISDAKAMAATIIANAETSPEEIIGLAQERRQKFEDDLRDIKESLRERVTAAPGEDKAAAIFS